jgi:hypothetical protein
MVAGICAYQNVISWDSIGALYPQKSQPPAKKSQSPFCQNPFKTLKIQGSRSTVPGLWDGSGVFLSERSAKAQSASCFFEGLVTASIWK